MLGRVIIIFVAACFAANCAVAAVLTVIGKNPATLHLTQFLKIGYAAINAVLIPFGISGFIGGFSRKKTLIRAFIRFQWWLSTSILIGLNVFNFILAKRNRGDFIRVCQGRLISLAKCVALANDAAQGAFLEMCIQGGTMILLGIVLLIVGQREYNNISLEEETKNLLEKANFNEKSENDELGRLPSDNANDGINVNNNVGRYETNVLRQPSKAATVNEDLARRQANIEQNSSLRRNVTDPNYAYNRDPPKRYPTNATDRSVNRINVTRQPTVGNAYAPRQATYPVVSPVSPQSAYPISPSQTSYPVVQSQAAYPVAPPQRSLSTKPYVSPMNPLQPSYATQIVIPPPPISDYNNDSYDYYDNYNPEPYTQMNAPHLTRMGINNNNID